VAIDLIPHGETHWNRQRRLQGIRDVPLNGAGWRQARGLAERFRHCSWTGMTVSESEKRHGKEHIVSKRSPERFQPRIGEPWQRVYRRSTSVLPNGGIYLLRSKGREITSEECLGHV
jgi:broad specificity phosphatase PhoE